MGVLNRQSVLRLSHCDFIRDAWQARVSLQHSAT